MPSERVRGRNGTYDKAKVESFRSLLASSPWVRGQASPGLVDVPASTPSSPSCSARGEEVPLYIPNTTAQLDIDERWADILWERIQTYLEDQWKLGPQPALLYMPRLEAHMRTLFPKIESEAVWERILEWRPIHTVESARELAKEPTGFLLPTIGYLRRRMGSSSYPPRWQTTRTIRIPPDSRWSNETRPTNSNSNVVRASGASAAAGLSNTGTVHQPYVAPQFRGAGAHERDPVLASGKWRAAEQSAKSRRPASERISQTANRPQRHADSTAPAAGALSSTARRATAPASTSTAGSAAPASASAPASGSVAGSAQGDTDTPVIHTASQPWRSGSRTMTGNISTRSSRPNVQPSPGTSSPWRSGPATAPPAEGPWTSARRFSSGFNETDSPGPRAHEYRSSETWAPHTPNHTAGGYCPPHRRNPSVVAGSRNEVVFQRSPAARTRITDPETRFQREDPATGDDHDNNNPADPDTDLDSHYDTDTDSDTEIPPLELRELADQASVLLEVYSKTSAGESDAVSYQTIKTVFENVSKIWGKYKTKANNPNPNPNPNPVAPRARPKIPGPSTEKEKGKRKEWYDLDVEDPALIVYSGCIMCCETVADTVLSPCNHLVLCSGCCDRMKIKEKPAPALPRSSIVEVDKVKCPLCRTLVKDRVCLTHCVAAGCAHCGGDELADRLN